MPIMSRESLLKAVAIAGGQVALASCMRAANPANKVTQAHVWKWLNGLKGETPPADQVIQISAATGWKITPSELRPDIYPHPQDGMPADLRDQAAA